jgi:hypothetical protein
MKPTWGNPIRNVSQGGGGGLFPPVGNEAKNRLPALGCETLIEITRRHSAARAGSAKRGACEHRLAVCVRTTASKQLNSL